MSQVRVAVFSKNGSWQSFTITATFQDTVEFGFEADDWVGSEVLVVEHDRVMPPAIVEKVHEET